MAATNLKALLLGIRDALSTTLSVPVLYRHALPLDADGNLTYPAGGQYVILDLIGATSESAGFSGASRVVYSDLVIQVGCWARNDAIDALVLAGQAQQALAGMDPPVTREQGPVGGDEPPAADYYGMIATFRLPAAYDSLT